MGAGGGGVLRNSEGDWIDECYRSLGHCSILHAELWALADGLEVAWIRGFRSIEVEMNNKEAIQIFSSPSSPFEPTLVCRFRDLLHCQWQITFKHIHREANGVADALALLGRTGTPTQSELAHPPVDMYRLLQLDLDKWRRRTPNC
ncbi:hypothetical protein F3Y22_tig00110015pilonHSYRG00162 [Hibiscus syriacus]|uniref:RNase H type-1 domain-containing protein n=1 Tax=Hibiscus syriacus TaxID=106335 RepID=A0A6A3BPP6_HIBSY|nr:hypothetical protein F3Y22_tig00110015pilonHSYRG00162 [Hibiscus syriacus]